jgi:hypothetical protein
LFLFWVSNFASSFVVSAHHHQGQLHSTPKPKTRQSIAEAVPMQAQPATSSAAEVPALGQVIDEVDGDAIVPARAQGTVTSNSGGAKAESTGGERLKGSDDSSHDALARGEVGRSPGNPFMLPILTGEAFDECFGSLG